MRTNGLLIYKNDSVANSRLIFWLLESEILFPYCISDLISEYSSIVEIEVHISLPVNLEEEHAEYFKRSSAGSK